MSILDKHEESTVNSQSLEWKVHARDLFTEILENKECAILKIPLNVLLDILKKTAERAAELNDKELNKLMMRLSLYAVSDPHDPEYNPELVNKYLES